MWEVESGMLFKEFREGHKNGVTFVGATSEFIFSWGYSENTLIIWNIETKN